MRRWGNVILCVGIGMFAAGCPKGGNEYDQARKSESLQDLDTALQYYQKAYNADPRNAGYRIKLNQIRFEASYFHVKQGQKLRENGDLQGAAAEFQRAATIDPSNDSAAQEVRKTLALITEKNRAMDAQATATTTDSREEIYASAPPELRPLSRSPINLKATDDAKVIFTAISKLAGVNVIFDTDFTARRIAVDLNNVTLEQALAIAGIQSKAWWKPVTENMIFVIPDTTQKHRDYDETVVKTFYLSNITQPQDLTDIANGLRQVAEIKKIQQLNSQNAIIVRDTPDKIAIAEKLIADIDKARPEVVIQVEVLSASTERMRDLGVLPGQSASLVFTPLTPTTTSSGGTGSSSTSSNLAPLKGFSFSVANYSVTLPGATATFILTDTATKIIQNPEIRSIDGQPAKLRIGSRVPIATGSFQAGVGVGTSAVNPLVNTQFTYLDVGVNVDITPHVHPNHEVSMKVSIEVSQVTGTQSIGGINQPIIGQRKFDQDIRLREGEVSILGGLFEQIDSNSLNGVPGLSEIPFLKYLTSENKKDHQQNDVLLVLIPRIVRLPDWTKANLRPILAGSEQQVQVRRESEIRTPSQQPVAPTTQAPVPNGAAAATPANTAPSNQMGGDPNASRVRFEPGALNLKVGETPTIGIAVDNVTDLFSIPMMIQFDPNMVSIEEVQHGAFLSGGNQEIAIVQRVDAEHGQAIISATRQPNTSGVSGSGTLLGLKIKAKAPGTTKISIVQVNARDSQQKGIPLVTGEATIQVQP